MESSAPAAATHPSSPDLRAIGAVGILAYFLVFGDLGWRDPHAAIRILSGLLASGVVIVYIVSAPRHADALDRRLLVAVLLFVAGAAFSAFPRQSLDSVLAVLLYAAGLYVARGVFASTRARRLLIVALRTLSGLITVIAAAQMLPPFIEWWALTEWTVFPPLSLKILPEPWVVRYELALLLVLLYPSWWIGKRGRIQIALAVILGALTAAICLIAGSRTVWLSAGCGAAAVTGPILLGKLRLEPRRVVLVITILAAMAVGLWLSGIGDVALERLVRVAPLAERASIWSALADGWSQRPITGYGPGSMPWVLQLTNYFDTHSFAPRQADNSVIQLLAEGGIVGLTAGALAAGTLVVAAFRGPSRTLRFVLTALLIAQVGTNPMEVAFLIAAGIAWIAYGLPRRAAIAQSHARSSSAMIRVPTFATMTVIGLAFWATVIGAIGYSSAKNAVVVGDYRAAGDQLRLAERLDPGLALYPRQLGTLMLVAGDPNGALSALERAVGANPSDDLAWRVLALAQSSAGDDHKAGQSIQRAVRLQRSDPTNLLLAIEFLEREGKREAAQTALAEAVQAWPYLVVAPGWQSLTGSSAPAPVLDLAAARWDRSEPSPVPLGNQRLLIRSMLGAAFVGEGAFSTLSAPLARAYVAVMECQSGAAEALSDIPDSDKRTALFWELNVRHAETVGTSSTDFRRIHLIMTSDRLLSQDVYLPLNPLNENGVRGSSPDTFGYRRSPIEWEEAGWELPSPRAGAALWHDRPVLSARNASLDRLSQECASRATAGGGSASAER